MPQLVYSSPRTSTRYHPDHQYDLRGSTRLRQDSHAISDLWMSILAVPMLTLACPLFFAGSFGQVSSTLPVMTSLIALM